MEYINKI